MTKEEIIGGLQDLIGDRESFITEEEEKAIERLAKSINSIEFAILYSQEEKDEDIKIALKIIQKQQKEIENYIRKTFENIIRRIDKVADKFENMAGDDVYRIIRTYIVDESNKFY